MVKSAVAFRHCVSLRPYVIHHHVLPWPRGGCSRTCSLSAGLLQTPYLNHGVALPRALITNLQLAAGTAHMHRHQRGIVASFAPEFRRRSAPRIHIAEAAEPYLPLALPLPACAGSCTYTHTHRRRRRHLRSDMPMDAPTESRGAALGLRITYADLPIVTVIHFHLP